MIAPIRRVETPRARLLDVLLLAVLVQELDVKGAGEVVAEVVGGAGLQGLAVVHHGLHGVGRARAGELLQLGLAAHEHGDGEHVLRKVAVDLQHLQGLLLGLLRRGVDGVPLLPEEFGGAQEEARALLPAHDVAPLVVLHGQVAPGLHPLGVHRAEDGLRRGADGQALGQGLAAALGDPSALRRKALDVVGLLHEQALGQEHGHVDVLVPGLLELGVQVLLDQLPDAVAIGLDDHAAAHGRIVDHVGLADHVRVPLGEVHVAGRDLLDEFLLGFVLCHDSSSLFGAKKRLRPQNPWGEALASRYHPNSAQKRAPFIRCAVTRRGGGSSPRPPGTGCGPRRGALLSAPGKRSLSPARCGAISPSQVMPLL